MRRAIVLFSGGLDSTLAVRILQEQGVTVEALNVRTTYACCKLPAAQAAAALGLELTVVSVADDYLDLIRRPLHGYGRGLNPCVDCRIYMCKMAKRLMLERGACAVVTGEVLGQRPKSQKRVALSLVERESGLEGRLLRPLSAKLLAPTIPECQGLIERQRLYAFSGRSRKGLVELAGQFGIRAIPAASSGCALASTSFAVRARDLLQREASPARWDFELLKIGRHVRIDAQVKAVLGRNALENAALDEFFTRHDAPKCTLLVPESFQGPSSLLVGPADEQHRRLAGALMLRHTRRFDAAAVWVRVFEAGRTGVMRVVSDTRVQSLCDL